ncbi:MAG TPA: hypothetical protein VN493_29210 [Thermoanaerobaculia bacterium]|nr:hypothetical protein [Thermoanaerobaculia bacterium]
MPIDLDRRSYLGLTRARFSLPGAEPRRAFRAFRRLGTVRPELGTVLRSTEEGKAGVRRYHRLLWLGYACSVLGALVLGIAASAAPLVDVLAAVHPRQRTPLASAALQYFEMLNPVLFALLALPLFLLAFLVDYQAYRSILGTIDAAPVPAAEEIP